MSKINDPKIVTERLKKDIIKLLIDEVVIEGESVKIFATIPLPNKIHEREMDPTPLKLRRAGKTDIPGTFNAGATLGPVNETNMARIWNKHKQTNTPLKRKVFVGLSGGVDSSVSAALLKERGFNVVGVFIKVWQPDFVECDWKKDRRDAMKVCAKLNIPYLFFDFEKEYKKEVVDYMIREYEAGRTPNPDVMCNKSIKFGAFLTKALLMGADYVATGHYARLDARRKTQDASQKNEIQLLTGKDENKDQSYFLWTLDQEKLSKIIFPVGDLKKSEVRKLAKKFGLITADKKDSQGLCFVGKVDMKDFLNHFIKEKKGDVLDYKGKKIGEHNGAFYYTIGQRHGFSINEKGVEDKPMYVIGKDIKKNTITVNDNPEEKVEFKEAVLTDINWISGKEPDFSKNYLARFRYRQELQKCKIEKTGKMVKIKFEKNQPTLTPGQSLVIYDGEECLGGGVIK